MRANEFLNEGIIDKLKGAFRGKAQNTPTPRNTPSPQSQPSPKPSSGPAPGSGPATLSGVNQERLARSILLSLEELTDPKILKNVLDALNQKVRGAQPQNDKIEPNVKPEAPAKQEPPQEEPAKQSPEEIRKQKQDAATQAALDQMAANTQQAQQTQQPPQGQQPQQPQQLPPSVPAVPKQGQQTAQPRKRKVDTSNATDVEVKPARQAQRQATPVLPGPTRRLAAPAAKAAPTATTPAATTPAATAPAAKAGPAASKPTRLRDPATGRYSTQQGIAGRQAFNQMAQQLTKTPAAPAATPMPPVRLK